MDDASPTLPEPSRFPRDALLLAASASALLILLQWTTVPKLWPVITLTTRFDHPSEFLAALRGLPWSVFDRAAGVVLVLLTASLLYQEIRHRSWTRFIDAAVSTDRRARLFVILGGCVSARFYFSPGRLTWTADAAYHTLYAWIAGEALVSGILPTWTPLVAAGTPFLQFYGFVFFWVSAVVYTLIKDLHVTLKLVLGGAHIASGLTVYLLCHQISRSRRAGLLAAAVYVLGFWHTQQVLVMGRYPVALIYALLPLPFWAFSSALEQGNKPGKTIIAGLALALLMLIHPGYGVWAGAFFLIFVGLNWLLAPDQREHTLRKGAGSIIVALLLSSVLTVPLVFERSETYLSSGFSLSGLPDPSLAQILLWSNYNTGLADVGEEYHWYGGYIGLSAVLLSLAGIAATMVRRKTPRPPVAFWFSVSGFVLAWTFIFAYRWPVIRDLPFLYAQNAGRYETFLLLFVSLLAGLALKPLARIVRQRPSTVLSIGLLLVGLDLMPTTLRQPYHFSTPRTVSRISAPLYDHLASMGARHEAETYPLERMVHTYPPRNGTLVASTRTPTIAGVYVEHPPSADRFLRPLIPLVEREVVRHGAYLNDWLATSDSARVLLDALYLTGARYHLTPVGDATRRGTIELTLNTHSPLVVSSSLVHQPALTPGSESELFDLVKEMNVDRERHLADHIPVTGPATHISSGGQLTTTLTDYEVRVDRVRLVTQVSSTCFARLAFGYYSNLQILVNGRPASIHETADGFVAIRLEPGENILDITGGTSALRRILWIIVGLTSLGCLIWIHRHRSSAVALTARR